jgi:(1->4)-alpha-D-glucan 1-alpha-D-glucosylmutase
MVEVLSTYRVQLQPGFGLAHLRSRVSYLSRLGVTHVYLSPILRARRGSTHGYDVVDPTALNPELGDETELRELVRELRRSGMGLVLDIVPNHMATGSENPFWEDVLTHGPSSQFSGWFDIDWGPQPARRAYRIFLPVLGAHLGHLIRDGELAVVYREGRFRIAYHEQSFPVDPATFPIILAVGLSESRTRSHGPDEVADLERIIVEFNNLPPRATASTATRRAERAAMAVRRLAELYEESIPVRTHVDSAAAAFGPAGDGPRLFRRLLAAQAYRLAYWRRAAREINYRRFFTVSHLVALRAEDPQVFAATHRRVMDWVGERLIDGLRVDHIDGLVDPRTYLERLHGGVARRAPAGDESDFPVFVEKILARDERLPSDWPIAGTTGYDFLGAVEDLFIDDRGFDALCEIYRHFVRRVPEYGEISRRSKRLILRRHLVAEIRRLARQLEALVRTDPRSAALTVDSLRDAIVEVLVCLPVYRTYVDATTTELRISDREVLERALAGARARRRAQDDALQLLADVLLLRSPAASREAADARIAFVQRFQQASVPAAAKGIEDTAFYRWYPLASRNEVGSQPDARSADSAAALHAANLRRAQDWPLAMLATSTHDSKRSADVRARLDVLSEVSDLWRQHIRSWRHLNRRHMTRVGRRYVPDRNSEYLFYQTLVGAWPLPDAGEGHSGPARSTISDDFRGRIEAYTRKAAREAKLQTSWVEPDAEYEAALLEFARRSLASDLSGRFLTDVAQFVQRIARPGLWNSLARTLVQLTAPGIPDIYQGDELWNFSLVDPDNRRPVDLDARERLLSDLSAAWEASASERQSLLQELVRKAEDGRIKLHVIHRALAARRGAAQLFRTGDYEALAVRGAAAKHVFAFARRLGGQAAITIVPRLPFTLTGDANVAPVGGVWADTVLSIPAALGTVGWTCALSGLAVRPAERSAPATLPVGDALAALPVALLVAG